MVRNNMIPHNGERVIYAEVVPCVSVKKEEPRGKWFWGTIIILVLSVIVGVFDRLHKETMARYAMENGYEQKQIEGNSREEFIWIKVTCKKCGSRELERNINNVMAKH